jgi:hypothetical protein
MRELLNEDLCNSFTEISNSKESASIIDLEIV